MPWLTPRLGFFKLDCLEPSLQSLQQSGPEVEEEELELDELDEVVLLFVIVDGVDVVSEFCDFDVASELCDLDVASDFCD